MYYHSTSRAHDPAGGTRSAPGSSTDDRRTTLGALGLCGVLLAAVAAASYPVLAVVVLATAVSTFVVTKHRETLTDTPGQLTPTRTRGRNRAVGLSH